MKHVLVAPAVEIAGKPCVVMMYMMAGISLKELGERVADLTNSFIAGCTRFSDQRLLGLFCQAQGKVYFALHRRNYAANSINPIKQIH